MLISLHEHFPVRITDWLLSAMLFSWGLALFAVAPSVWTLQTFSGLSWIASQTAWAVIATGIGLARMAALFVNGALRRSPHLRGIGAFVSVLIWAQISFGMLFSVFTGPAAAIYPWLAFADIFNVYRAAKDAWVADARASKHRASAARRVSPST